MKHLTLRESLIAEFLALKNELLRKMRPEEYIYLFEHPEGSGIALGGDDTLLQRIKPEVTLYPTPLVPEDLLSFIREHLNQDLSDEECLQLVSQRLKELLNGV